MPRPFTMCSARVVRLEIVMLAVVLFAASLPVVEAQPSEEQSSRGIGVSPNKIDYGAVVRAEPIARYIEVQNGMDRPAELAIQRDGALAEWVDVPADRLIVPPNTTQRVPLTLQMPADARNGLYDANLTVVLRPDEAADATHVGVQVGVTIRLSATLGGAETILLEAGRFDVSDAEENSSLAFSFWARNRGNVRVVPEVEVQILNAENRVIHTGTLAGPEIRSGMEEQVLLRLSPDLPHGQYWLRGIVRAGGAVAMDEALTFDVLEPGALRRRGEIGAIHTVDFETKTRNHRLPVRTAFIIQVPFQNVGEVDVDAHFEGYISKGGSIVKELKTSPLRVDRGESVTMEIVIPGFDAAGQYSIRGKVFYGGKITSESEWILNLEGPDQLNAAGSANTPGLGVPLALAGLCGVALLLRWSKKER